MKNLFYAGLLAFLPSFLTAQNNACRTTPADLGALQVRLHQNLAIPPVAGQRSTTFIPLRFHLVADDAGTGRLKIRRLLDELCAINADFADGGMQFYLHGADLFDNLNNDQVNENAFDNNAAQFVMETLRDTGAINIFVVKEVSSFDSPFPGDAAYYEFANNWMVGTKGIFTPPHYFISHEIGHYFSLLHTFHGWDAPFMAGYPGWPQAPDSIWGNPVELMDGSNCSEAGDLICDTPPDYMFSAFDCLPYTGGALDPDGQPVDPMEDNMMSYFFSCSDYKFTNGQFAAMNAELASPAQSILDVNFVPVATEILTPSGLLVSPPPSFYFPGNTDIQLDWLDVAGATHYLVELDITPMYTTPLALEFVTTASELLVPVDLSPNKTYHWRVRPFNAYVGCATTMASEFKTGPAVSSSVQVLADGSRLELAPNPVPADGSVQIQLDLKRAGSAQLMVLDATGRAVWTETRSLPSGLCQWSLDGKHLVPGMNWVKIEVNGQVLTQGIVRE